MTRLALGPALLFCPADRPERFDKALERADAVILDLEDGVAPADRPRAREALVAFATRWQESQQAREADAGDGTVDADRVIVRVNAASSPDFGADLDAVRATPFRTIMLAKAESIAELDELVAGLGPVGIIALCETAKGVLAARELAAHPATIALMWGAEDLVVSLGGTSSRTADGAYREVARFARSAVLLAAAAHGVDAIDAVHIDLDDLDGLAVEAQDAVASGFAATACLHPSHAQVVRQAYRPSEDAVARAREVLAAAGEASGALRVEGRMIDEPLVAQARAVLARAGSSGADSRPAGPIPG